MRIFFTLLVLSSLAAAQATPELPSVLKHGAELVAAGRLPEAQELYESAITSAPDNPDLRFELGMVYYRQKHWDKAIDNFNRSLTHAPGRIKSLYYLAEAYFMESDLDAARDTMAQAATLAPNDAQVSQKYGEFLSSTIETRQQGLEWLQKARRLDPGLTRIDFEIGKAQFELTDFRSARASLELALKGDSDDGEAAYYLAESWASVGEWERARDSYRYSLSHGYENEQPYYGLGRALVELADFADALDPLQHALALKPSLAKAHFQLGKAYRQLGRTQEAQHQEKLFSAMTDRVDTSHELNGPEAAKAWKQVKPLLEHNREQQALDLLSKLPADAGSNLPQPHYLLGKMYFTLGRQEDAKRVLILARKQDAQSARIAAYLGMVELSKGEVASADELFQSALSEDSGEALALIGLGGIRYQQQRWHDAADYLEKSRTADPGTLYMLCDAYFRTGRTDDALLTAEVIRAFAADQPGLLDEVAKLVALHQSK